MPHVGDGDIHAYLDGALELYAPVDAEQIRAHLTDCPDCAARLEDERELRSRSEAILAGSGPAAPDVPSFEEIRARADATGAPRTRARRGIPPILAWAASLILALGTGWAARGAFRASPEFRQAGTAAEAPLSTASADLDEENAPAPSSELLEAVGAVESNEVDAVTEVEEGGDEGFAVAAATPPAEPTLREADAVTPDDARAEAALADRAEPQQRVSLDAQVEAGLPTSRSIAEEQESPSLGVERRARRADQPLVLPVGGGTIMIPGLEVRSVEFDSSSPTSGVRIVQVLPGGEALELFYLRSADGTADEAGPGARGGASAGVGWPDEIPAGWSSAVLRREGGWLLVRSPIVLDSLNALMDSLR
jgi:hypothetical protein